MLRGASITQGALGIQAANILGFVLAAVEDFLMPPPLTDTRVLDLSTGSVGGIATMVLADFGAEVVKVEPVGGDPWRALAAAPMWLRGKRSIELDVDSERERLDALIREADVVVSTDSPAQAKARRLEHSDIRALNESAVFCSITGFGRPAPMPSIPPMRAWSRPRRVE